MKGQSLEQWLTRDADRVLCFQSGPCMVDDGQSETTNAPSDLTYSKVVQCELWIPISFSERENGSTQQGEACLFVELCEIIEIQPLLSSAATRTDHED